MILLCDEDVGTGVPNALKLVGLESLALVDLGWGGHPDVQWLTWASRNGWLVFSYNKKMLLVPSERNTIIREKVGIVYLTKGGQHPSKILRLLLTKWDALDLLHTTTERPFARFLSPNGRLADTFSRGKRHYQL